MDLKAAEVESMLREMDLQKLNSMTKYPSIPTYHALGDKGALTDERVELPDTRLIATEKVDGTNSRIIRLPDGSYVIGSREELLHAKGDIIWNPALGIVDALKELADRMVGCRPGVPQAIYVFYLEVFGGRVTANSKQYSGEGRVGYRMFDIAQIDDFETVLQKPVEELARWRDDGGQSFVDEAALATEAARWRIDLTPRITIDRIPVKHQDVLVWLKSVVPRTGCRLDDKAGGRAEGLVVRTSDRSVIVKIRYEDYERHLRRLAKQGA